MDAETLARAVEPFFSTKGVGKGTGLGLSMVFGLAQQSGGALLLESAPSSGTTARLWLPAASETKVPSGQTRNIVTQASGPAKILFVDDDLLIAGTTAFDGDLAALDAIMAEWTSARSYAERVANLSGTGNGPRANGDVFLMASGPGATVFDDGAVNWLQGASGMDWYFAKRSGSVTDIITGLRDSEIVEDLGS